MSRHARVDSIVTCANAQFVRADWAAAVEEHPRPSEGALARFLHRHSELMSLAGLGASNAIRSELNEPLWHQVFLGCMSATETYFRDAVAVVVRACPHVRANFAGTSVNFGSVDYYAPDAIGYALLESESMASSERVADVLYKKFGVRRVAGSALEMQLREFDRACQIRHALIHANGLISGVGARKLGLGAARLQVRLNYSTLSDVAAVCRDLVLMANDELFKSLLWRLVLDGVLVGVKRTDEAVLRPLHENFSEEASASHESWRDLHDDVKRILVDLTS